MVYKNKNIQRTVQRRCNLRRLNNLRFVDIEVEKTAQLFSYLYIYYFLQDRNVLLKFSNNSSEAPEICKLICDQSWNWM